MSGSVGPWAETFTGIGVISHHTDKQARDIMWKNWSYSEVSSPARHSACQANLAHIKQIPCGWWGDSGLPSEKMAVKRNITLCLAGFVPQRVENLGEIRDWCRCGFVFVSPKCQEVENLFSQRERLTLIFRVERKKNTEIPHVYISFQACELKSQCLSSIAIIKAHINVLSVIEFVFCLRACDCFKAYYRISV